MNKLIIVVLAVVAFFGMVALASPSVEVDLPDMPDMPDMPDIDLPKMDLPGVDLPDMPDMPNLPGVDVDMPSMPSLNSEYL